MNLPRATYRGFTLIETLAALAIGSLLLATLLAVATGTKRGELALAAKTVADDRGEELVQLLRADLTHARRFTFGESVLELDGHGSFDLETLRFWHRPSLVSYELAAVGERSVLVRRDRRVDGPTSTRLVAFDVAAFTLEPRPRPRDDDPDWRPRSVRLTLSLTPSVGAPTTIAREITLP